ncbi:MAG TPA: class I SAM-dependent methyltransferase [Ktedonobacteraceae bacterium]|nr:class I SAM-dependent methyltransferase [Ktedonobacteraceae bacterium]
MSEETNTYIIDHESGAEMQRLIDQDKLLNKHMGTLFPDGIDPSRLRHVLDVACGPAAWILNVAFAHQHIHAVGVDISQAMIEYGEAFANVQKLDNAELLVMDILQPLEFADETFDFVNARMLEGIVKEHLWLVLLKELMRVTAPGGYIRLTEPLYIQANSPAYNRIMSLIWQAFERDGRATQKDAAGNHMNIGMRLAEFFASAGITLTGEQTYHLDWSWGTEAYQSGMRDAVFFFTLMQPFLVNKVQVVSKEEYEQLLQSLNIELYRDDFKGTWVLKSVWGQKPV